MFYFKSRNRNYKTLPHEICFLFECNFENFIAIFIEIYDFHDLN